MHICVATRDSTMPVDSPEKYKRINVLVRTDQYETVAKAGLNMSGLMRGLLDDHFSDEKIVFSVSARVKKFYQHVISNFGAEDTDLEVYFLQALDQYLAEKTRQIETLRKTIKS